ncbi:sugar ABC transporter permease [Paenibacillus sp. MMS18-CY102]|uniref:sugar ABC transporter permease n=1 Tax=Paenibacillus sp. MMS18-CY102 TaxID=2682849 RepID=UPI001365E8D4|nr:sugar ABC transporter permease [Paenibacillus sp. MMS18-CY102]MWC30839.1 ABC transporter permease subunit [Paenibacillus sp. MMS18-CY102]
MRQHRTTAAVLSAVFMGLGQLYNRQYAKGISFIVVYAAAIYYAINNLGHALWGIATLGETKQHMEKVGRLTQRVPGDHSIFLMIEGLITIFVVLLVIYLFINNIRDAYSGGKLREEGKKLNTIRETFLFILDKKFPQLVITIPLVFVFFFTILPIIFSILIAFTNYNNTHEPPGNLVDWQGLRAFKDLLGLSQWAHTFIGVFTWTMVWAVLATFTTFFGGFAVALLVQQKGIRFKSVFRAIYMIPYAIPAFLSLLIMRNLFNAQFGPINTMLLKLGIVGPEWLSDPTWAKATIIMVNVWLGYPASMLLIIGILTTIPRDLYEAAEVDGASAYYKFRKITFPSVMFSLAPIFIGQFVGNINNFNVIYLLSSGGPTNSEYQFAGHTDILITWLYSLSITNGRYNFAAVVSIFLFIIIAVFANFSFRRTRSFREEDNLR